MKSVSKELFDEAVGNYTMNAMLPQCKPTGRVITMGIDQGRQSHVVICEWLYQPRLICKVLWVGIVEDWRQFDALIYEWQVQAVVVDADPEVQKARELTQRFPECIKLCRFNSGTHLVGDTDINGILMADRKRSITKSLRRFRVKPQVIQLPNDIPLEFKNQICAFDDNGHIAIADHYVCALTYADLAFQQLCSLVIEPRQVVLVREDNRGREALYVDGTLLKTGVFNTTELLTVLTECGILDGHTCHVCVNELDDVQQFPRVLTNMHVRLSK